MTKQIEGVPEGWELVGIRRARKGEFSVGGGEGGLPRVWDFDSASVYPIVRKSLKVEAGKWYEQANGKVVGPMYKWMGPTQGKWNWTHAALVGLWTDSGEHIDGLVKRLVAEAKPSLKVEIGKYYRRIDGNIVGPMQHGSPYDDYPFQTAGRYWNEAGVRWCGVDREKQNLVEEVPAPEPPKPEYRPFANAAEFKPHRHKWIKRNGTATAEGCFKVSSYSEAGVHVLDAEIIKYAKLLEWQFEDGTPCGVKQ